MDHPILAHRLRQFLAPILIGAALVGYSPASRAQGATGAINGSVTDATGAVIPDAHVLLMNEATGAQRVAVTNATGTYVFPEVSPGTYTFVVSKEGFTTAREEKVTLAVNQTATHDFTLSVGTTRQEVSVSGVATHIESSTAELGTVVATHEVNDLPLNGRNFTQLLQLTPGVSPISTAQNAGGGGQWGGNTIGTFTFPSVNGQCNRCNYFLLDGFNDGQVFMGMVGTTPIIDGLQEFKVQSHNDSSSYGGALGGIVNVATKAGTNQYHGDVWEFLRNSSLDAANYFENVTGSPTTPYKQNQFGGTVGGPLIPGRFRSGAAKTWFFASYEGFRSVRNNQTLLNVPTPTELAGDLSSLPNQIYNPFSTQPNPASPGSFIRAPFMCDSGGNPLPATNNIQPAGTPCKKIPTSMINQQLLSFMTPDLPAPNAAITAQTGGTSNAVDLTPQRIRQDTASIRFDHQFSDKDSAWIRYTGFTQPDSFPYGWPGSSQNLYEHGYQGAVSYTHVFGGGSKVLTAGFARNSQQTNQQARLGVPDNLWQTAGFSPAYAAQFVQSGELNPNVTISGFNTRPGGKIQETHMSDVYEWKGDFTWVHGRHTFQTGADFATNNTHSPIEYIDQGFNVAQTSQDGKGVVGGESLASFLLAVPDTADYRNVNETTHGGWVDGFYFQDSWKATSRLTVNIGLRYDLTLWPIYGSLADKNQWVGDMDVDHGTYILARNAPACDPSAGVGAPCIPGGTLPANVMLTPFSNHAIYHNTYDNLGPRLGLAYRLRQSTVLRGAFGKFYDNWGATSQLSQNYEGTWPSVEQQLVQQLNYPTSAAALPSTTYADPFHAATGSVPLPAPTPFGQLQWFIDPRVQNAYSEQWNLGVQQSLGSATVLEADYVGQHSSRLNEGGLRNVATTPGPGDPSLRYPYPYMTPTYYDKSIGKATYNAFQFKLRRTTSKGLSYIVSYTWSKIINLGCDGYFGAEGCSVQQVYNLKDDRSVAGFDIPQSLSTSWTYNLPFGKGMRFNTGNKVADALIGPWAVNGLFTIRSGEPVTLGVSGDIANIGGNSERPNVVGPLYPSNRIWQSYINTSSFQVPAAYTFGDLGRNALRLGDYSNWDISIFRDFPIPLNEATRLQFRAEFFNAFNHAVLGGCLDTTQQDVNFGVANCTRNDSREIQFALKFYF